MMLNIDLSNTFIKVDGTETKRGVCMCTEQQRVKK